MHKIPRHLVITADEETWKQNRPILFSGEWCLLYNRQHIWKNIDGLLAVPYGLGQNQKNIDHDETRKLREKLFPKFYKLLNEHHLLQYDQRQWMILLGHWFQRTVEVIFNRVRTLENCVKEYNVCSISDNGLSGNLLVTENSHASILSFNSDQWNHALALRLIKILEIRGIQIEPRIKVCLRPSNSGFKNKSPIGKKRLNNQAFKTVLNNIAVILRKIGVESKVFIINSYLPPFEAIKLQVALGQWPVFWQNNELKIVAKPDLSVRTSLNRKIFEETEDNVEKAITSLIFDLLPICYLEGFDELKNKINLLPWPVSPKCIFTSNNFDTDEIFKLWVCTKIKTGSKYVVGQHGNYGVSRNHLQPSIEEITSDKFITWGWTDGLPQHSPAFLFKIAGQRRRVYDCRGGLLLIQLNNPHRITTWNNTNEFSKYFEDQKLFVGRLSEKPRSQLTIRLHSGYKISDWAEDLRWHDFDPSIRLDYGLINVKNLIQKSRLVVHSYDSTGILETLAQNIPTLAFWQNGLDHLRDSAKPFYEKLLDAEVLHLTAESVAKKVNSIWENIDEWWQQNKVQDARKIFCERYARESKNPTTDLVRLLQE